MKNVVLGLLVLIHVIALAGVNPAEAQVAYTVGGGLSGLAAGKTITLLNNSGDPLTLSADGGFTFPNTLSGGPYAVSIAIQPLGQFCSVSNGSGTISNANITNVGVSCSSTYTVGGAISGLTSSGLVLRLNATNLIIANGATTFKFATALTDGSPYNVSVGIQPVGMSCTVSNGAGVINATNITNVAVTCNKTYSVGGTISGLTASGLILKLNGGANKIVSSGSIAFNFATALISGAIYTVTIQQQPTGLTCLLFNASGTIGSTSVSTVVVSCQPAFPPAAPVPTVSYNRNPNQIILNWAPVSGATYYTISKDTSGSSAFSPICQASSPTATTCIDAYTKLTDFIAANYKVSACNAAGCTESITLAAFTTQTTQYLKASTTYAGNFFGQSFAISSDGSTLAVGAVNESSAATGINGNQGDNSAPGAGAVYVFTRSGNTWSQQAYVKASNTNEYDGFGSSVALSADGNTLAVGAGGEDSASTGINANQADNSAFEAGAVYVFTRSGTTWNQQAYIKASNANEGDYFGSSVALSADGNTLAVGSWCESSNATGINGNQTDSNAACAGAVYVFTHIGTTWSQQAYIKASNTNAGDNFGYSVTLSGDGSTLAVGAYQESSAATGINGNQADNSARFAGAVYVFARSGASWSQQAYIKASNTDADDYFGTSVSLTGDGRILAVGAQSEYGNATGINGDQADNSVQYAGAVYIFTFSGSTWSQQAYIKASNTGEGDAFGYSIALSADGSTLAVGALCEASSTTGINGTQADNSAPNAGAVYVY